MKPLFTLALLALPAFAAFPNGYSYCKVVTTSVSMVSGTSDLTNYPLTVILTDADLRTVGNGGLVNNANGYDIGFYPNCSGSGTALKWEMESYSATTGAIVAHVLRPTLSHTTNDTIGMYYGGSFSSFQSTPSAVWDANYKGVWHLPDGSSLSVADSTGLNTATNHGAAPTAGKVDGAGSFASSSSQYIDMGNASGLQITSAVTIEGWINTTNLANDGVTYRRPFSKCSGTSQTALGYEIVLAPGASGWADNKLYFQTGKGTSGGLNAAVANTAVSVGVWYHVVGVYDGATGAIYINGAPQASAFSASGAIVDSGNNFAIGNIGANNDNGSHWNGAADEVRVSNIARSADWILTQYRNQSAPGTYISTGQRITGGTGRLRRVVIGGA